MKTILVPTDFSKGAVYAARTAARLAEKLHTSVLLWNCGLKLPIAPPYLGGTMAVAVMAGTTESTHQLERAVMELEDFILATDGDYKPQLLTRYREGILAEELAKELQEHEVEMIVIGSSTGSNTEHIFTGSDASKIIETADCPVFIIPPKGGLDLLDKVVFATNFEPEDLRAILYLHKLSEKLNFALEIVHVITSGHMDLTLIAKETAFNAQLIALKSHLISYRQIRGKQVIGQLNRICKQTGADVLAMTHHQYSFFKRLLTDSVAKKELAHQKVPLLLFPIG